jgi:hypothetical protein
MGKKEEEERWVRGREGLENVIARYDSMGGGEDGMFLNNCRGFLVYTLPMSTGMFLVVWKLYWRLHKTKYFKLLPRTFSSWTYFLLSIFGDNIRYLSFRCSQQLRFLFAITPTPYLVSNVLSIVILFLTCFLSITLYLLLPTNKSSDSNKYLPTPSSPNPRPSFQTPIFTNHLASHFLLATLSFTKLITGWTHAYLDNTSIQISVLLLMQCLVLGVVIGGVTLSRYKSSYVFLMCGEMVKGVLVMAEWVWVWGNGKRED